MPAPLPTVLAIGVVLGLAGRADAEGCRRDGVLVFPAPRSVVPTNSRFILEGFGQEQRRVAGLVGREVVLKGGDDFVKAKVQKGWTGTRGRVAVVLWPTRALKANRAYELELDSLLPGFQWMDEAAALPVRWLTGESADVKAPAYRLKPAISEGFYRAEGPNITEFVKIHTSLVEQSPVYLIVTLRRVRGSGGTQTYFVPLNGGEGVVGRDACGGGFAFEPGRAYRAAIEVFDSSGNKGPALAPVEFQAPKPIGP